MPWVILGLRLLLAGMFAVAAVTKLAGRDFNRSLHEFGVPALLVPPFAILFPLAEIAVAVALLPARSAAGGAAGATVLLTAFTVAAAVNLALGRHPDCNCFGRMSSGPIGAGTLARNLALVSIAAVVLASGPRAGTISGVAWVQRLDVAEAVLLAVAVTAAALLAWTVPPIRRRIEQAGRALLRVAAPEADGAETASSHPIAAAAPVGGLPVGAPAPAFALNTLDGHAESLDSLLAAGRPVLLAFVDPRCERCTELLPELAAWQRQGDAPYTVALLTRHSLAENHEKAGGYGLAHVLLQEEREMMDAYHVNATPSMVAVLPDGTIASPLARWAAEMRALVARFAADAGG